MELFESILDEPHSDSVDHMFKYAKKHHDATGAVRKHSGNPYWEHPESVASLAKAYGGTEEEVMTALSHDTLEDTDISVEDLAKKFGPRIAELVAEITNDNERIKQIGKEQYMNEELCELSHPALFVKLCDMLYNMLDYPKKQQAERMVRNLDYLLDKRADDIDDREAELIDSCFMAYESLAA